MRLRQGIFLVHLTTGCVAAAVIFFLAATGFLLAWQKPIVAWQEREYRATVPQMGPAMPLDKITAIATATEEERPTAIVIDAGESDPVEVDFEHDRRLFLNPRSGAVLGRGAVRTRAFFTVVTGLHRWFGMAPEHHASAKLVKGAFTLALLLMIATGLWLWMPRAWSGRRVRAGALLRFGLSGRARDWNRHSVAGLWAAVPLTVIALTGAILAYGWMTRLVYVATASPLPTPVRATQTLARHPRLAASITPGISLQQVFEQTGLQSSGWHEIRVAIPRSADSTIEASVDFGNGGRPNQQVRIAYDRVSGAVVTLTTFSSFSPGQQIRSFMKYIHTGEAGGFVGETIAGLTALVCCILIWTGMAMALRRLQGQRIASRRAAKVSGTGMETASGVPAD